MTRPKPNAQPRGGIDKQRHARTGEIEAALVAIWPGPESLTGLALRLGVSRSAVTRTARRMMRAGSLPYPRPAHEDRADAPPPDLTLADNGKPRQTDPPRPKRPSYSGRNWMEDDYQIRRRFELRLLEPMGEGLTEAEALLLEARYPRRTA